MYKSDGASVSNGMHRPEGAGNFDNMDDYNIVNSMDIKEIKINPYEIKKEVNGLVVKNTDIGNEGALAIGTEKGDGTDDSNLIAIGAINWETFNDFELLEMGWNAGSSSYRIKTTSIGTGTDRPLNIYTGTNTDQLLLNIDGTITIGAGKLRVSDELEINGRSIRIYNTASDETVIKWHSDGGDVGTKRFLMKYKSEVTDDLSELQFSTLTDNSSSSTTIATLDRLGNFHIDGEIKADTGAHLGGATNYTEVKSDGEINLHGTARVIKCITIRVGGFNAPGESPADFEALGIAGCYAFASTSDQYISTEITIPVDMDISIAPTLIIDWSAAATTGTAVWRLEYLYRAPGEDVTASAQETLTRESDPSGTSNGLVRAELTGIDLPSATDRIMLVRISRDTSDAIYTDDMAGDAHLTAIKICYTSNKLGTAL